MAGRRRRRLNRSKNQFCARTETKSCGNSNCRLLVNKSVCTKTCDIVELIHDMSDEIDICDVFDEILLSEDKIIQGAYLEGYEKGKKDGEVDGYHNGYHRGGEIGLEIGFYKGVANAISTSDIARSDKIRRILGKLTELLDKFPKTNDHDLNIWTELSDVRAQYKKLCSIAKLSLPYPTMPKESF